MGFEVPKRDCYRWDGHFNYYTKDCASCQWYRKIEDFELCGGGVSFKYLVKADKQRKCTFKNMKQDKERSVVYLDEIIAALANQKAKFTAQNPSLDLFSTD